MKFAKSMLCLFLVSALATFAGCAKEGSSPESPNQSNSTSASLIDGSKFVLTAEPQGANDVIKVREVAKDGDEVVIQGRIGGSENPWVEGRAAFSIVDPSLKSCAECGSHDCPKPWDYC